MLNSEYVIGLVDGEGSFYIRVNEDPKRRNKIEFKFSVKLRHQDKEILDNLKQFFGCGNVYLQRDPRPNHTDCYRFEVNKKEDIFNKIIPFFEKNPPKIQSRRRDFDLFKQISRLSQQTILDREKIKSLKQEMHWGLAVYGKSVRTVGNQVAL